MLFKLWNTGQNGRIKTLSKIGFHKEIRRKTYFTANKRIIANGDGQKVIVGITTSTKFYVFDTKKGTFTTGSMADLEQGGTFYAKRNYDNATEIVIYR